jgi:group I intron endonuclease
MFSSISHVMGEIYCIRNNINGSMYIGQCKLNSSGRPYGINRRWGKHKSNAKYEKDACPLLERAIREYGSEHFKVSVLLRCEIDKLDYYENVFISMYNTRYPHGYNLMAGGQDYRRGHSNLTIEKMTATRRGETRHVEHKTASEQQKMENKQKDSIDHRCIYMKPDTKIAYDIFLAQINLPHLPMYIKFRYHKSNIHGFRTGFPKRLNIPDRQFTQCDSTRKNYDAIMEYYNSRFNGSRLEGPSQA